jgi:hypothetical protein
VALASIGQDNFGGGMFRSRRNAPPNTVYDAVNALVNDEGLLYRRGGSEYQSTTDTTEDIELLWDGQLTPGRRTAFVTSDGSTSDAFYVLDTDDATPVTVLSGLTQTFGPPTEVDGYLAFPDRASNTCLIYGGSRKTANYSTGTVTVANGSTTVTGVGTSWAANADAGMIFAKALTTDEFAIVASVASDTSLTLRDPWPYTSLSGASYNLYRGFNAIFTDLPTDDGLVAGTAARRLLLGQGSRVYFSERGQPMNLDPSDYHSIPDGSTVTGIKSLGDSAVVFTTAGVWVIGNMSLDAVDAFGNVQQTMQRISGDVILWGDGGIAAWAGGLLVPAGDDVHVLGLDGQTATVSENIRPLYRAYVKAGYRPGIAAVHRGHYILPVLDGTAQIATLVCRLDRGAAWTRWDGHAAAVAFVERVTDYTPTLLGATGQRVTDLSFCFAPTAASASDADGTAHACTITTNDYPTGGNQPGFVQRIRLRYELVNDGAGSTPTVAVKYSSDQDSGATTTLTDKGVQAGGEGADVGGGVSKGDKYMWWTVGKRRERIRFEIAQTAAASTFTLRGIEVLLRPSGKQ